MTPLETTLAVPSVTPDAARRPLMAGSAGNTLRRQWARLIVFLLPILLILGPVVFWIDPYDLFHHSSPISDAVREQYAGKLNPVLWKILAFENSPEPNIVLGDSTMARLPAHEMQAVSGMPYFNLAFPGGTLRESIAAFWQASRRIELKHVMFGLSFGQYNAYMRDRVDEAEAVYHNPTLYFMNSDVLEAGYYESADVFFHHPTYLGPKMTRDAFWQSQLQSLTYTYGREADPGALRDQLRSIVAYAKANGIALTFVIPPLHVDAQHRIPELHVQDQYERFKADLASMTTVYDCDTDNEITRSRDNYADPFHMEPAASREIVADLWSGHPVICRVLGPRP